MREYIDRIVNEIGRLPGVSGDELRGLMRLIWMSCVNNVPGAIVELGCAQGHTTTYFRRVLDKVGGDRELHVCDSFEGLPEKREEDGDSANFVKGSFAMGTDVIRGTFQQAGLALPIIHVGWFSEIRDYPDQIAFAFIDGDFYDSMTDGINAVWPRLSNGGTIAVHDYNHPELPGAKMAVDDFLSRNGIVLEKTDGDGIYYFTKQP